MYAVRLHGPRDVRLDVLPDPPAPGPGELLVRTVATAISAGTELAAISGRYGTDFYGWPFEPPSVLGYLNVGRVVEAGPDARAAQPGDVLLTFRPHVERFVLPVDEQRWRVPAAVDPSVAAFTYLISLGGHALRRAGLERGESVAVVGLGPVGLGAVAMAKQRGAHVTAVDPLAHRRTIAARLGADVVREPDHAEVAAVAADVVVEAAGTWPGFETAMVAAADRGRIAIAALHPALGSANPLGERFYAKQVSLISASFQPASGSADGPTLQSSCEEILAAIADGRLDFAPAVTHRVPFVELPSVYKALEAGTMAAGAVAVAWE